MKDPLFPAGGRSSPAPPSGMLSGMDSTAATASVVVLGVAGLGLFLVVMAAVLLRPGRRTGPARAGRRLPPPVDDLPAFRAHPPGSPGAPARRAAVGAPVPLAPPGPRGGTDAQPVPTDDGVRVIRFLLALAALALALIAAAAAVALRSARAEPSGPGAPPPAAGPSRTVAVPDLPAVPDSPAPGQPGAGELAYVSLPPGPGYTRARMSFGGVVLEQQAVGSTVTRPAAGLTTSGRQALLHLRLPTWNCLAPEVPDDPAAAGCVPSVTEYGDLPSPALSMSSDGNSLLVQGRVPTYTRPNGSPPVYTGRAYEVTLTVSPARRLAPGRYVAVGSLTLGSGTTRTDGDPALNVITRPR